MYWPAAFPKVLNPYVLLRVAGVGKKQIGPEKMIFRPNARRTSHRHIYKDRYRVECVYGFGIRKVSIAFGILCFAAYLCASHTRGTSETGVRERKLNSNESAFRVQTTFDDLVRAETNTASCVVKEHGGV